MTSPGRGEEATSAPRPLLSVRHAAGHYPVHVGAGLLADLPSLADRHLPGRALVIIADAEVARYIPPVWSDPPPPPLLVPPGEGSKTREEWARLSDALAERGVGRDGAVIAIGGGMVGDLAGFVAATWQRGIPVLQVPTTLLAMIDASVGGKTGVDTPAGKNLVGAFHPPVAVVADVEVLQTLPERHLRAGLAEAVKHGAIASGEYFGQVERMIPGVLSRDSDVLQKVVAGSVRIKAGIVEADEREAGPRATLNAGHTIGHAVELLSEWSLLHGEAVAIGLVLEAQLAARLGLADAAVATRLAALLRAADLPISLPPSLAHPEALVTAMTRDKKNRDHEIRFSFIEAIGRAHPGDRHGTTPVEAAVLREFLEKPRT